MIRKKSSGRIIPKLINIIVTISTVFFLFIQMSFAQTWTHLFPTGGTPTTRYGHTAVYDNTNNKMIIYGGYFIDSSSFGHYLNDIWVLSNANGVGGTPSWEHFIPTSSNSTQLRKFHSSVYDSTNSQMIVFGGDNNGLRNDVWVVSHANGLGGTPAWTKLFPTGSAPTTRDSHSAVYDTINNKMMIFGGSDGISRLNDVWILNNANGLVGAASWANLTTSGSNPTARKGHSAVYDTTNNIMVVFGGQQLNGNYLNDVWLFNHANGLGGTSFWSRLTAQGGPPSGRFYHSAFYDKTNNRMTVFGGYSSNTFMNDTWVLTHANGLGGTPTWSKLSTTGNPMGRYHHSEVYDSSSNRMTLYAGSTTTTISSGLALDDVWVLTFANGVPIGDWMQYASGMEAIKE